MNPSSARRRALRAAYDRDAPTYEDRFAALQAPKLAALWERCPPGAQERVLDLGCGTGLLLRALPQGSAPSPLPWGLDLSAGMLRQFERAGEGVEGIRARRVQGDLTRLPFRAASFDLVYSLTALLVTPREAAGAFLEVARVLRPGGRYAFTLLARDCWEGLPQDLRAAGLEPRIEFSAGQDRGWVCWASGGAREAGAS